MSELPRPPLPRPTQVDREKILLALKRAIKAQRALWEAIHELDQSLPVDYDAVFEAFGIEPRPHVYVFDYGDDPLAHFTNYLLDFVEQIADPYLCGHDLLNYSSSSPDAPDIDILLSSVHKAIKCDQQPGGAK